MMQLVNLLTPYGFRVGAMESGGFVDVQAAEVMRLRASGVPAEQALVQAARTLPADMMEFLETGSAGVEAARRALSYAGQVHAGTAPWYPAETELGAIVPRPSKIYVMRGNYRRHRAEMGPRIGTSLETPDRPRYFSKPASAIIGHGQAVVCPRISRDVQHEIELAVVIGKRARGISPSDVQGYLAGYTILLDMTARDLSGKDDRNKGFDTFCPIGPCLVPAEDISDPYDLAMTLRVNGELRQQGSTRDMEFKVAEIVCFLSEAMTLLPGDVISTGTPEGVGRVQPGEVIEAEIEHLGKLRCPVVAET